MNEINIEITNSENKQSYIPLIKGELDIEYYRSMMPTKAAFSVLKDNIINFNEGSEVKIETGGKKIFKGYVFTKTRSKDGVIKVTAYDQLRYLKNKGTYNFYNISGSDIVKQIAKDYRIEVGEIENSGYIISELISDGKTLFDVIQTAVDITYENTGRLYILFDNFGKLSFKRAESMVQDYMVQDSTAENFSYTSTIDSGVYNQIRLTLKGRNGIIQEYFKKDEKNISRWGVLQYNGSVEKEENGNAKAENLLKLHNKCMRKLSINGAFGDMNVRGGSIIYVRTDETGDIKIDQKMTVEYCKHCFRGNVHTMDMNLKGGLINDD